MRQSYRPNFERDACRRRGYPFIVPHLLPLRKMAAETNGTLEAPIEVSSLPTVVGINFGNSYASISVLNKVSYCKQ